MSKRIVMTLLVRDEADILRANLEFHLAQGVDHFVIMDNLSTDSTPSIIREYVDRGVATALSQPADDYAQAEWVTGMARLACTGLGADWVINNDADEFWLPLRETTLREVFGTLDAGVGVVVAQRHNFIVVEGPQAFYERMVYRHARSTNAVGQPLPPKVAHRAGAAVLVAQGNHSVSGVAGDRAEGLIEILHFPMRSFAQFENKIAKGGAAYERNTVLHPSIGETWRTLYRAHRSGRLGAAYAKEVQTREQVAAGLASGALVLDERLRNFMRAGGR